MDAIETEEFIYNDTFKSDAPTWANACVGENGFQDIETYCEGFRQAPSILLDTALADQSLTTLTDTLVFPIAFCIRHAIELQIKDSILKLRKIRNNHIIESYKVTGTHDIGLIWDFFKEHALKTDRRYKELIDQINPYINDFSEIDPTGQTFRYPHDDSNEKHLKKTPIINLLVLKKRYDELEKLLEKVNTLNNTLIYEYSLGTYTKKLSRNDIYEIAKRIPNRNQWGNNSDFLKQKKEIQHEYELSNNNFSEALDIIQNHYEFSQEIGLELSPLNTIEEEVVTFFSFLDILHPEKTIDPSDLGTNYSARTAEDLEKMKKRIEETNKYIKECIDKIPSSSLADIAALYELGRHYNHSEAYKSIFNTEVKIIKANEKEIEKYLIERVGRLFKKTNGKTSIVKALKKLGQQTMLNSLCEKFEYLKKNNLYGH